MRRFFVPQLVIGLIILAMVSTSCSGGSKEYSNLNAELQTLVNEVSSDFNKMSLSLEQWSSSEELADAVSAMQSAAESSSKLVQTETALIGKAVEVMNQANTDEQVKAAQDTVDSYSAHLDIMKSLESSMVSLSYTQNALYSLSGAVNAIDASRRSKSDGSTNSVISEASATLDHLSDPVESGALEKAIGTEPTTAVADMISILSSLSSADSESDAIWADEIDSGVLDSEAALSELKGKASGLTREVMKRIESISSSSNPELEE